MFDAHRHVAYVLAGSQRSLIDSMIDSKKNGGLYKMVDVLCVPPIPVEPVSPWIADRAASTGVVFGDDIARAIITVAGPRTRDVVQLARAVWNITHAHGVAAQADVAAAMDDLVREQSAHHQGTWDRFKSDTQRRILMLITKNSSTELTAAATMRKYHLGAKSTVDRTLKTLIRDEHVITTAGGHYLDDPFLKRWIELHVFKEFNFAVPSLITRAEAAGTSTLHG